jgi:hypothetical protein
LLHESLVEIKSKHPFLSKFIGTPFMSPLVVLHPVFEIGREGKIDSFEIKLPCPSLIAICAPEIEFE